MKKLLASASFLVLGSASALAADLPMKAAPYMAPAPVFSWTGCYIGVHGGGGALMSSPSSGNSGKQLILIRCARQWRSRRRPARLQLPGW